LHVDQTRLCTGPFHNHHVTRMLESNSYIPYLLIDFSKAFDVSRKILLTKLKAMKLLQFVLNWIISFSLL